MLKIQNRGTSRSVWLVGPTMKIGAAKNSELVVQGEGVAEHHCNLHVDENTVVLEVDKGNLTLVNNKPISGRFTLSLGDVITIGEQELVVINPKQASAAVSAAKPSVNPVSSSAAAQSKASGWILQGLNNNIQNKRFPVDGKMFLGRSKECDLHFSFERLSRKHAVLKVIDGKLLVEDLDSSNGTFHNGKRVKRATLSPGDSLAFDKLEFTILGKKDINDNAQTVRWDNSLNQTVVRSAITPEMIEKAEAANKPANKVQEAPVDMIQPGSASTSSTSTAVIAVLALVVVGLAAAVFFM